MCGINSISVLICKAEQREIQRTNILIPRGKGGRMNQESESESESEVTQSRPTLCNPMDCSLPVSSVHGIFQARTLEWVAISFSRGSSNPGIESRSPTLLQADALLSEPPGKPDINSLLCIKQIINEDILYSIGNSSWCWAVT